MTGIDWGHGYDKHVHTIASVHGNTITITDTQIISAGDRIIIYRPTVRLTLRETLRLLAYRIRTMDAGDWFGLAALATLAAIVGVAL